MIDIPGGRFQYSGFNTIFSDTRNLTPSFYRLLSFDRTFRTPFFDSDVIFACCIDPSGHNKYRRINTQCL